MSEPTILDILREIQERGKPRDQKTFAEWSQERRAGALGKAPATGGHQTNLESGYGPGFGMMGHLNTSSRVGTGPYFQPSGNQGVGLKQWPQQYGVPNGVTPPFAQRSKYDDVRLNQPPPWISDVNMSSIWYSPFEPVWPFGPPYYNVPREWNYPVGYNLNYVPERMGLYQMLRGMRQSWGVLATIEATRMDQLLRIPWTIQRRDRPRQRSVGVDSMRQFFRRPDGKQTFGQWTRRLLFDLFDLDAPSIFMYRDAQDRLKYAENLDGATIFPLIDDTGRRPDADLIVETDGEVEYLRRQPAFQQIIYGLPMVNLSEDELMYPMMRPRPEMPIFGYSPIEQMMVEATEAIRKTFYQLDFWRAGSMPELIVTVPDGWNPRQIAMFQAHFDALLAGNIRQKSQVRFLPGGMRPFDIKNASGESLWSQRDETLIRLACYAFSVSPAPFIRMMNRATAQNAQQTAQEEGLYPLMSWFKDDVIDVIIQDKFGYEDVEFVFQPRPEPDQEKAAKIHDTKIKNGEMSRNEARAEDGLEPIPGGDVYTIEIGNAIVPVEMAAKGMAMPQGSIGATSTGGESNSSHPPSTSTHQSPGPPNSAPQRGPARPTSASPIPPPTPVHKATQADVDAAARGATEDLETLSPEQIHAGNYPKGHLSFQGLRISIENNTGSKRGERTQSGKKHFVRMPAPYGYIRGTIGADKSQLDIYLGKHPESTTVWVIDQDKVSHKKGNNKGFDEHKIMLGYPSLKAALHDYLASHFDGRGHDRLHAVVEMSMPEFKEWLARGDTKAPVSDQDFGHVVLRQKDLKKIGDTISSATNLLSYDQTTAVPRKRRRRKRTRRLTAGPRFLTLNA